MPADSPAKEKFLVIGSNSFSGAHFVAGALRQGAQVVGVSRSPEPDEAFLPYKWTDHSRFKFHQLDLNKHTDEITALAEREKPQYVVNYSAQSMVAQSWVHPEHWFATNVVSTIKLHDRLRKMDFIRRYVHASTPEVYGSCSGLVPETAPFNPSTPYAVSKAACDMSLMTFFKAYKFPVVFTRAANVCGPGQQLFRIIPKTVFCILTGEKLKLEGGGHSVRSFIHMDDVVDGTLKATRDGTPPGVYHLATDKNQTIRETVTEVCRQMNVPFEKCVQVTEGRLGQDSAYLLDCAKARKELNWTPKIGLEEIVRQTIEWMKKYFDRLRTLPADYIHKP
jgi:dTDP-glucose 4,6-dehydratase